MQERTPIPTRNTITTITTSPTHRSGISEALGEFERRASWHTHEQSHAALTHSHDDYEADEIDHHGTEVHIHDHAHPTTAPGLEHRCRAATGMHLPPMAALPRGRRSRKETTMSEQQTTAVMEREQAGKDRRVRGERQRRGAGRVREDHPFAGESLQIRSERADAIRAEGVEGDEEDVGALRFGPRTGRGKSGEEKN